MKDKTITERMRIMRAKDKERGIVSVTVRVPIERRDEVIKQAERWRNEDR